MDIIYPTIEFATSGPRSGIVIILLRPKRFSPLIRVRTAWWYCLRRERHTAHMYSTEAEDTKKG